MRQADGRPNAAMLPSVNLPNGENLGQIVLLINKLQAFDHTPEFSHIYRKTLDPALRREAAIKLLAASYYQIPDEFSELLSASFSPDSNLARQLVDAGKCQLHFSQFNQTYLLNCTVKRLEEDDYYFQATFWHNLLFNPLLSTQSYILQFKIESLSSQDD